MKKGFTIIELIISIFILSVAVVGIFGAFSIVTILTADSVDRLTASYLAQEGVELIRNVRDTNWLSMDDCKDCAEWDDMLSPAATERDYIRWFGLWQSRYLNIDASGFYSYNSGTATKFKRKITLSSPKDVDNNIGHIIKVKVEVSWDKKATILSPSMLADTCVDGKNCIVVEDTLYDWYNYKHQ